MRAKAIFFHARTALAIEHFTLQDIVGCAAGVLAFSPFLLAPGYLFGYGFDLLHFREASWRERGLLSILLSIAFTPILATLLGRLLPLVGVCALFAAAAVVAVGLAVRQFQQEGQRSIGRLSRETKVVLAIFAGWTALAILSLSDIQIGSKLYLPVEIFDQGLRSALTGAAVRTGVPPVNPFFYPGHFVVERYYYYWNVLCALPAKLFGLSARATALAGVVWAGFALAALVPVYLKHFCEETEGLARKSVIGIGLLALTGLDLIPTIMVFLAQRQIYGDMEWWDGTQVASWIDSLLWVPHHISGLIACFVGFLILWDVPRDASWGKRCTSAVFAALAFATAAGMSVYVTFTFAIFLITWTIVLLRSRLLAEAGMFVLAGVTTVAVSIPYLRELQAPGWGGAFASFYVRALESTADWADANIEADWLQNVLLVVLLPIYYLIELGFFASIGGLQLKTFWQRAEPLRKWEWASLCIGGASLLVGTFLQSTSGNNDLGYRSVLIVQFILLLWAAPVVSRWSLSGERRPHMLFSTFLLIGILGSAYQLVELRVFTMLVDRHEYVDEVPWLPKTDTIAHDVYLARSGFAVLESRLPQDAVIQYGPTNPAYVLNVSYIRRQLVDGLPNCGTPFGGDPFLCLQYQNRLLNAFNGRRPFTWQEADQLCSELHIDLLIAERPDRMWAIRQSWVWTGTPVVQNDYLRAIPCGSRRQEIENRFR